MNFELSNEYFSIHSHVRRSVSPSDELRVDTKAADQTCCLYGLDMVSGMLILRRKSGKQRGLLFEIISFG